VLGGSTLRGIERRAIVRLLGRPDGTNCTPQIDLRNGQYDYYVGTERGYVGIDMEVLAVSFDRRGRGRRVVLHPS
jgi:hypothetical protein